MKLNRLIILGVITLSTIFASYYGGNISYAFFYVSLFIPIMAFLYTVYVYFQFKIYQSVDSHLVVKGDWTMYSFIIANEDFITFRNVKVNFFRDKSTIESADQIVEYSLLPGESERMETRMKCNYRGEYYVGVDSIEVTDFLSLFTITYPLGSKLKAYVLPRIVQLEQLGIAPVQNDVKNPLRFHNVEEGILDTEIRKYSPGDTKKRINWKVSARLHELVSRKYQYIPKAEIVLFMDLMKIQEEELKVVISEDKIIELVLAIVNFYALRNTSSQIIYELDGKKQIIIATREDFDAYYKNCATLHFHSNIKISELIEERTLRGEEGLFCITVTHFLTKELYMASMQLMSNGNRMCILLVSDDVSEDAKELINNMKQFGIAVYQVMSEDDIEDILSGKI